MITVPNYLLPWHIAPLPQVMADGTFMVGGRSMAMHGGPTEATYGRAGRMKSCHPFFSRQKSRSKNCARLSLGSPLKLSPPACIIDIARCIGIGTIVGRE
jgi:hypothetical protein